MDIMDIIRARHSVRSYLDKPIEENLKEKIRAEADAVNAESGLRFVPVFDEPLAFAGMLARYGSFKGCRNYIVAIGKKDDDERIGYFGERLVLFLQGLGLNSCWVALTYNKRKVDVEAQEGNKIHVVIAMGYGDGCGVSHKNAPKEKLCEVKVGYEPEWFTVAMEAAMLAPTALNHQKFRITLESDGTVSARALIAPYADMDLGIVKYHFELGAAYAGKNFRF
jgi:nitroreductase